MCLVVIKKTMVRKTERERINATNTTAFSHTDNLIFSDQLSIKIYVRIKSKNLFQERQPMNKIIRLKGLLNGREIEKRRSSKLYWN